MLTLSLALCICRIAVNGAVEGPHCPQPSGAVSRGGSGMPVEVTFRSKWDVKLDLMFVSVKGELVNVATFDVEASQKSVAGHVFRVMTHEEGSSDSRGSFLVLEYRASGELHQKVDVPMCRRLEAVLKRRPASLSSREAEFEALVHEPLEGDNFAPCGPEKESDKWSCVRLIPRDSCEEMHRNMLSAAEGREFGFQLPQGKRKAGAYEDRSFDWQQEVVPKLTDGHGFLKMSMTKSLRETLLTWYQTSASPTSVKAEELVSGGFVNDKEVRNDFLPLNVSLRENFVGEMKQVLEWWSKGTELKHEATYGVRIYRRNATLLNHLDRFDSHIASAILQVGQTVDRDGGWPVEVLSSSRDCFEVYLQPGEILLYEGARYAHGRPMRFRGEMFANVFTHFSPLHWHGHVDEL